MKHEFLDKLFKFRKIYYRLAAQALKPGQPSYGVTCWVDTILAKLGEAIVAVAGDSIDQGCEDGPFETQRVNALPHTASQLPGN